MRIESAVDASEKASKRAEECLEKTAEFNASFQKYSVLWIFAASLFSSMATGIWIIWGLLR